MEREKKKLKTGRESEGNGITIIYENNSKEAPMRLWSARSRETKVVKMVPRNNASGSSFHNRKRDDNTTTISSSACATEADEFTASKACHAGVT